MNETTNTKAGVVYHNATCKVYESSHSFSSRYFVTGRSHRHVLDPRPSRKVLEIFGRHGRELAHTVVLPFYGTTTSVVLALKLRSKKPYTSFVHLPSIVNPSYSHLVLLSTTCHEHTTGETKKEGGGRGGLRSLNRDDIHRRDRKLKFICIFVILYLSYYKVCGKEKQSHAAVGTMNNPYKLRIRKKTGLKHLSAHDLNRCQDVPRPSAVSRGGSHRKEYSSCSRGLSLPDW